jgi:DtxR family Mn-dependent transcriptional regulator
MELSSSQEEYLIAMYEIMSEDHKVRVTDIAKKLGITKPSVNKAINNLKELGLVNYEKYQDVEITDIAIELAKDALKRQDVIYIFLNKVLGVEEKQALEDSMAMKHVVSEETTIKLNNYILKTFNLVCNFDVSNEKCKNCIKINKNSVDKSY